jgi:hypothetical protein
LRADGKSRQSRGTEIGIVLGPRHPEGVAVPVPQRHVYPSWSHGHGEAVASGLDDEIAIHTVVKGARIRLER